MGIISIFVFIFGFVSFFNKRKHITLLVIAILATNWFSFTENIIRFGTITFQHSDLALLLIFSLLPFRNKINIKDFKPIEKALLYFLIFLLISIAYDMIINGTSIVQVFRTVRNNGFLFFIFLIPSFSKKDFWIFFKWIIAITIIQSILYISQYIFGYSLIGERAISIDANGSLRYGNTPYFLLIIFIYYIYNFTSSRYRTSIFFIILSFVIILSQSRGLLLAAVGGLMVFLYIQKKYRIRAVIFLTFVIIIGSFLVENYFSGAGSRYSEGIQQLNLLSRGEVNYANLKGLYHQGSFIFRWGVLYERFVYVISDIKRILLGVGFVPDFDLHTKIFVLGTASPVLPVGFEQYNTADMFLPNIITRYGIVGSILFLYFIYTFFVFSFKYRHQFWGKILFTLLWSLMITSFATNALYLCFTFFMIFILMGLTMPSLYTEEKSLLQ